jgi:NADP-dependent 3-hydroxy acid dehydrogenase YdfG
VIALAQLFTDYPTVAVGLGSTAYGASKLFQRGLTSLGVKRQKTSESRLTQIQNALTNTTPAQTVMEKGAKIEKEAETRPLTRGQEAANQFVQWIKTKLSP